MSTVSRDFPSLVLCLTWLLDHITKSKKPNLAHLSENAKLSMKLTKCDTILVSNKPRAKSRFKVKNPIILLLCSPKLANVCLHFLSITYFTYLFVVFLIDLLLLNLNFLFRFKCRSNYFSMLSLNFRHTKVYDIILGKNSFLSTVIQTCCNAVFHSSFSTTQRCRH